MYERKGHNGFKLKNRKGDIGGSKFCVSVALIPLLPLNRRDEDCRERGEIFQPGGNFFLDRKRTPDSLFPLWVVIKTTGGNI